MASFDIINAVLNAYQLIWRERYYLMRLGLAPFLLAYLDFALVGLMGDDIPPLRRGLMLMPAMVAEAWLVCQFLRTVMTGERWPVARNYDPNGAIPMPILLRMRGLLSGIAVYLLIGVLFNAAGGVTATLYQDGTLKKLAESGDPVYALTNFAIIFVAIRFFKYLWVFIPMVINQPPRIYLNNLPGWMPNIHMIGLWLAACLPVLAGTLFALSILSPITAIEGPAGFIGFLFLKVFDVTAQLGISLIGSTAMTLALGPYLFMKAKKP